MKVVMFYLLTLSFPLVFPGAATGKMGTSQV